MKMKRYRVLGLLASVLLFGSASAGAETEQEQIVSFDEEEVEVRIDSEFDYWPVSKLGTLPISILAEDDSNFVQIDTGEHGIIWVSLSYVTTAGQQSMKKNCQVQQISESSGRRQFSARGVGESCASR